jgi:hypothetical protein
VNVQERGHLEDMIFDGRIILKRILKVGVERVDWLYFAQVRVSGELS